VNAATADPKIDIANGEEARELLGQSMGLENELIGQSIFPRPPSPLARGLFFLTGRYSQDILEILSRTGRLRAEYAVNSRVYARWKAGHA
jgi:hypothetical protein